MNKGVFCECMEGFLEAESCKTFLDARFRG